MLLETRKATLVIKRQLILTALCSSLWWKMELVGHLKLETQLMKLNVDVAARVLPVLLVKCEGAR